MFSGSSLIGLLSLDAWNSFRDWVSAADEATHKTFKFLVCKEAGSRPTRKASLLNLTSVAEHLVHKHDSNVKTTQYHHVRLLVKLCKQNFNSMEINNKKIQLLGLRAFCSQVLWLLLRRPYNLHCVGGDVKSRSVNQFYFYWPNVIGSGKIKL